MAENPTLELIETVSKSMTYKKKTCRDLYIHVSYRTDEPEKIDYIIISASSKDNNCAVSFLQTLADMTSFAIRRIRNEYEARAIIKNLRYQKCLQCPPNRDHACSCSDALGQVLEEVLFKNEKSQE